MKDKVLSICDRLEEDLLVENPTLHHVLENDHALEYKLRKFVETLDDAQRSQWSELNHELDLARRYARLATLTHAHERGKELDEDLKKIKEVTKSAPDYQKAMVEIEREAHSHTGKITDVVKSLFMWKENPEEHIKK